MSAITIFGSYLLSIIFLSTRLFNVAVNYNFKRGVVETKYKKEKVKSIKLEDSNVATFSIFAFAVFALFLMIIQILLALQKT